ncbi:hypothetical protein LCGC14_2286360, partial [marine sediment metagenome]
MKVSLKKISHTFLLIVFSILSINTSTAISQIADSPYPMFLHDLKHTGRSPYQVSKVNGLKWHQLTGGEIWSSPVIGADNTIYVSSTDGNLYAFNTDGTLKWDYQTGKELFGTPAIDADGTIYVGGDNKKLLAINPDRKIKWPCFIGSDVHSSPAIDKDGTIYVGAWDGKLYAINKNGTRKWSYTTGSNILSSSPAIGDDGTIEFEFNDILNSTTPQIVNLTPTSNKLNTIKISTKKSGILL